MTSSRGGKKMWCVPRVDEAYIERMEDVLELYERPRDPLQPVVCLDERPAVLHGEKRERSSAKPGREARYDCEYVRKGTANIFCVVEPLAGKHITRVTSKRKGSDFAKMMFAVARHYPEAKTIHIVMDNLSTHTYASLEHFYGPEKAKQIWSRFSIHYTPVHASWLNMAEIEIGLLDRQCLGKRRFGDEANLRDEVRAWNQRINRAKTRIEGTYSRERARVQFGYKPTNLKLPSH